MSISKTAITIAIAVSAACLVAIGACGSFSGSAGGGSTAGEGDASGGSADGAASQNDGGVEIDAHVFPDGAIALDDGGVDAGVKACAWNAPFTSASFLDIDTDAGEGTPRLTPDELTMYFFRGTPDGRSDIAAAVRKNVTTPFAVDDSAIAALDTSAVELDAVVTTDSLTMFFTSDRNRNDPILNRIFVASRMTTAAPFAGPTTLTIASSTAYDEYAPFVAPLSGDLWFARQEPAAKTKIVHATSSNGGFMPAVEEPVINGDFGDDYPVLTNDELTIFFASLRPDGVSRIWVAHRSATSDAFGAPALVQELATLFPGGNGAMRPSWISSDGCRLYAFSFTATHDGNHAYVASRAP